MRTKSLLLITAALLMMVSWGFAQDGRAFRQGYIEGYNHGAIDNQSGRDFDYKHSQKFQSGISYDSYTNSQFRIGYKEGYEDGYTTRNSRFELTGDHEDFRDAYREGYQDGYYRRSSDKDDYDDFDVDDDDHIDFNRNNLYMRNAFVTVYGDRAFRGSVRQFRVGRYPSLEGRWNDSIDSIRIHGPLRVVLFDERDFRGKRLVVNMDAVDLDHANFADRAASMIIEPR